MVRESLKDPTCRLSLFLFLASCSLGGGRNRKQPKSTGQPYEVVLEGDTDSIVTKILTEEVPALPQPEPLCRLIQVKKGKIHGSYLLVRTRIVVNIPAAEFSVRLSRNENASLPDRHPASPCPLAAATQRETQPRETAPARR